MAIIYALICTLLTTAGQALWKYSLKDIGQFELSLTFLKLLLGSRYFITGTFFYCVATIFWLYLLSKYEFSYVYPLMSFTYIYALVLGYFLLNEVIGFTKIVGVMSIVFGAFLISYK